MELLHELHDRRHHHMVTHDPRYARTPIAASTSTAASSAAHGRPGTENLN
jgi:hypothetical protein